MFMETQASVQFQDVSRQQIELVMHALEQLDEHAGLLAERLRAYENPGLTFKPIAQHLDNLYGRYVMAQQRTTHQRASGATPPATPRQERTKPAGQSPAPSRIELF